MSQADQRSDVFVQFGASGDLAKKMTFVSMYHLAASGRFDIQGDCTEPDTYQRVKDAVGDAQRPLFYLEIPLGRFETVVKGLYEAGLTVNARVVIEKPFGTDLESAKALNVALGKRALLHSGRQVPRHGHRDLNGRQSTPREPGAGPHLRTRLHGAGRGRRNGRRVRGMGRSHRVGRRRTRLTKRRFAAESLKSHISV